MSTTLVNTFPAHPKLDEHELLLAEMQFADFRSANLFRLLTHYVRPGTVLDMGCGGGMVAWLVEHGTRAVSTSTPTRWLPRVAS